MFIGLIKELNVPDSVPRSDHIPCVATLNGRYMVLEQIQKEVVCLNLLPKFVIHII